MKITLRLILSLVVTVTLISGLFSYFTVRLEKARLTTELEHRASLLAEGMKDSISVLIQKGSLKKLAILLEKVAANKRVAGVGVYGIDGAPIALSKELQGIRPAIPHILQKEFTDDTGYGGYDSLDGKKVYVYAIPTLDEQEQRHSILVIFNDAAYIDEHLKDIWQRNFLRTTVNALFIALITLLVIRWSVVGPIAQMAEWIKQMGKGRVDEPFKLPADEMFSPISKEVSSLAKSLAFAQARAEQEALLRQHAEAIWTADRLKGHVRSKLGEKKLVVVSNREPFEHIREGRKILCISPASGLVTALDPILKACGGTWLAHGSGNADKETVDKHNVVRVPPDNPLYELKRVWLTQEEEEGYYYGFSNEGLWPLCHIAHTRPIFRANDWARYQEVNFKFGKALEETINDETYILVQDYHFSLLPRMVRNKHPKVKLAVFWHIPWPNPEVFGICPWRREILHGMLAADIVGFHTQFHCNNFLETVDRNLECRINWERFSVTRSGHTTYVKPFPISVNSTLPPHDIAIKSKEELFKENGIKGSLLGLGVDRLDYTKGIIERFRAVERFLEKNPEYRGLFTFVQIGAPSREHIKRYHDFIGEVTAEADRINWRFQSGNWRPIILLKRHFSHAEIEPFYRYADFCMVTSLHDGMNLVAKEFIVSQENCGGSLILSTFTGASRELRDALLINPYDTEQVADAIKAALEMPLEERESRMKRMRETVRENNIYKWAADIVTELTQIRHE